MSKNIAIQEGGKNRNMTAKKLKTALHGGGSCLWVPSSERQRTIISIGENGVYAPEGYYGFSQVTVNTRPEGEANSITGRGRDGNEYTYSKPGEGEGEELTKTKVPSMIAVSKYPNTTKYGVGAYLSFDGIEVKAFDAQEKFMYMVPTEELIFPVTQAPWEPGDPQTIVEIPDYTDSGTVQITQISDITAIIDAFCDKIAAMKGLPHRDGASDWKSALSSASGKAATFSVTSFKDTTISSTFYVYVFDVVVGQSARLGNREEYTRLLGGIGETTVGGVKAFGVLGSPQVITKGYSNLFVGETTGGVQYDASNINAKALTVTNAIPVQWRRPGDGKLLECFFFIEVVPGPSGTDS